MRGWRGLLLCSTLIVSPSIADADPVTAVALATTVLTATASALLPATLAAIASVAIGIGGALLRQQLAPNANTDRQREYRSIEADPHPKFRFAFGEFPQGGKLVGQFSKDAYYYAVILLNSIPSHSVSHMLIDDNVRLDFATPANLYTMTAGGGSEIADIAGSNPGHQYDGDVMKVWIGRGDHTQMPQEWLDDLGAEVQSTDIWQGATVAFLRLRWAYDQYDATRWKRIPPDILWHGKWGKLYDPRKDSSSGVTGASGTHDPDDPTTWEYTSGSDDIGANPGLATLMLAFHAKALGFDREMIPIQQYADAADACGDSASTTANLLTNPGFETAGGVSGQADGWTNVDSGGGEWTRGTTAQAFTFTGPRTGSWLIFGDTNPAGDPYQDVDVSAYAGSIDSGRETADASIYFHGGSTETNKTVKLTVQFYDSGMSLISSASSATYTANDLNGAWSQVTVSQAVPATCRTIRFLIDGTGPGGSQLQIAADDASLTLTSSGTTGYGARFRVDGVVDIEERELSLLQPVLDAMGGHLDTTYGLLGVRAGVWVAPTYTMTQPVGDEIDVKGARDAGFDKVVAKFISRTRGYESTDGPGYTIRAGNRIHRLHLPLVREVEQAGLLESIFAQRAEPNRIVTATWDGREAKRALGERVNFALDGQGRVSSTYVVDSKTPVFFKNDAVRSKDGGLVNEYQITLVEDLEATYDWPPGAGWTDPEEVTPSSTAAAVIVAPSSVTAAQNDYRNQAGTDTARLKVTVTLTSAAVTRADTVRVQVNDGTGWVDLALREPDTTVVVYEPDPATVAVTYTARARTESGALGVSDWVESGSVTIVAASVSVRLLEDGSSRLVETGYNRLLE